MVIGACYLLLQMPESHSLKEKRGVVQSIVQRVRKRFNVSIAEVDQLDSWQVAGVGFTCISNSSRHVDEMMQNVIRFVEENLIGGYLADVSTEVIHLK